MRKKTVLIILSVLLGVAYSFAAGTFTLVIDAGHGGHDTGAKGAYSQEKDINLRVALAFGQYVEQNCNDVKVIYTRTSDVFIPLKQRANIANRNNADLFISDTQMLWLAEGLYVVSRSTRWECTAQRTIST